MPARRSAPSTTPPPKPVRPEAKEPTRDALRTALAERERELSEALERQTATAEILRVISQSPADPRPVFERIVLAAARALKCDLAAALVCDGGGYSVAASANAQGLMTDFVPAVRVPIDPSANFPSRAILGKAMVHLPDWSRIDAPPHERAVQDLTGARSSLYLPLLREDECIGVLALVGARPNSFGPAEIAQAESFGDQALIAIENARLFHETQEALEQQKASAEVLGAIGKSVADTAPVFGTILDACQRLFGSEEIGIYTIGDDQMVRATAWRGPRAEEALRDVTPVGESVTGRLIRERRMHHIPDLVAEPGLSATVRERAERLGSASLLYAPMLWEDNGLGSILVVRSPPKPFSQQEHALLQSFADQAAIAIQNARLFNETKEALERQTATANVLKVISRSVSDATPVFETILESCQRLFGLEAVAVYLVEGDMVRGVAHRGWAVGDWGKDAMPLAGSSTGLAIAERRAVHIPDLAEKTGLPEKFARPLREGGGMTVLYAPMLSEDDGVGSIVVSRKPAKPFSDKEIALVQSFADQAAIAIQNARLFNETKEALERQTATAEVLKVISRSAFDLDLAKTTILEAAAKLCRAPLATLHLRDGDVCRLDTQFGLPEAFEREARENPIPVRYPLHARRAARAGEFAHFSDAWTDPDYLYKASARLGGYRAIVVIPLMREGELVGIFSLGRPEPEPFTESQIELVQSFADQAAIAIENARLFNEVRARTDDLTEALRFQTATSDVLKAISQSPNSLQPVLDVIVETSRSLCGVQELTVLMLDGDKYRLAAESGLEESFREYLLSNPIAFEQRGSSTARAAREKRTVHIPDVTRDLEYGEGPMGRRGPRALLSVPLMRKETAVGVITLLQPDLTPFSARQIEAVETFADQALIAIENTRLFEEVQARTRDLTEALAQQTATADVLKVISRSAFDLQVVLDTLTASATKLCDGDRAAIFQRRGDHYHFVSNYGFSEEMESFARANPLPTGSSGGITRAGRDRKSIYIPDVLADPEYTQSGYQSRGDYRTLLSTPLMRGGEPIGGFVITRKAVRPFNDRQIELLQTFADQAVIAIENVRLFDEVQARTHDLTEALRFQTATSDVLKAISQSPNALEPVLDVIVETSRNLCGAQELAVFMLDGRSYRLAADFGTRGELSRVSEFRSNRPRATRLLDGEGGEGDANRPHSRHHPGPRVRRGTDGERRPASASLRAAHAKGNRSRRHHASPAGRHAIHAAADRCGRNLRRSGDHRHRERAAVRRGPGAHARPHGGACAADRDGGGAEGHQPFGVRSASRIRHAHRLGSRAERVA